MVSDFLANHIKILEIYEGTKEMEKTTNDRTLPGLMISKDGRHSMAVCEIK